MKKTLTLAGITLLALPAAAYAQDRGHDRHHRGGMDRMMATYDTNEDGQITQEEIDGFRATRLAEFDTDGNGSLSLSEYEALWLDAYRERMVDNFQRHDDDGDGMVTVEEFGEDQSRIVARMDSNDDGVLTQDDRMKKRKSRK